MQIGMLKVIVCLDIDCIYRQGPATDKVDCLLAIRLVEEIYSTHLKNTFGKSKLILSVTVDAEGNIRHPRDHKSMKIIKKSQPTVSDRHGSGIAGNSLRMNTYSVN